MLSVRTAGVEDLNFSRAVLEIGENQKWLKFYEKLVGYMTFRGRFNA